jgi:nitroimidazol reductase NimA-like FMN-containing flavoprotein (pyridoxamine 5'-phosphate oxidase superfamily)
VNDADSTPPARSPEQRRRDTLEKLDDGVDLWIASASDDGNAYLIPLSYYWDGTALTIATRRESRTARNLIRARTARVALGPTQLHDAA